MKEKLLIEKDLNVSKFKPLFDLLQSKDLIFLDPIDVTFLVDLKLLGKSDLSPIYLWNQISDPNLGIHDFIKVEDDKTPQFKWVVVDGEIYPIEDLCLPDKNPLETELLHVMNNVYKQGKLVQYFVAEGCYEGHDGVHFCLVPFNDLLSCEVLEVLFGSELINDFQKNWDVGKLDLKKYFNPDSVEYCYSLYTEHFERTLNFVNII